MINAVIMIGAIMNNNLGLLIDAIREEDTQKEILNHFVKIIKEETGKDELTDAWQEYKRGHNIE